MPPIWWRSSAAPPPPPAPAAARVTTSTTFICLTTAGAANLHRARLGADAVARHRHTARSSSPPAPSPPLSPPPEGRRQRSTPALSVASSVSAAHPHTGNLNQPDARSRRATRTSACPADSRPPRYTEGEVRFPFRLAWNSTASYVGLLAASFAPGPLRQLHLRPADQRLRLRQHVPRLPSAEAGAAGIRRARDRRTDPDGLRRNSRHPPAHRPRPAACWRRSNPKRWPWTSSWPTATPRRMPRSPRPFTPRPIWCSPPS